MIKGDIITKFDGKDITSMTGLKEKLSTKKAGTKVKIVVKRSDNGEYKEKTLTVTLGKKSDASASSSDSNTQDQGNSQNTQNSQNQQGSQGYYGNSQQNNSIFGR